MSAVQTTENRSITLDSWRTRIQRVTDWLLDNLDQPFDLDRLAEMAHFSPFHFHRVYSAMMGEPVAVTVRRMRLHRAAVMLVTTAQPVAAIAKKAGYGSVQAFGRAFREHYGAAPAQYRQHTQTSLALVQASIKQGKIMKADLPKGLGASPESAVEIVNLARVRLAAWPHRGNYNSIGDSFQKITAWAVGRQLIAPQTNMFGLYYDDPSSKPVADLRSDACIQVPEDFELSPTDMPVHLTYSTGGCCARVVFTGPYAELHTAYRWLYEVWLSLSGYEPNDQPPMEVYLNDPRSLPPAKWRTAICIPLADKP